MKQLRHYNRWLTHPTGEKEGATITHSKFKFENSMQWANGTEDTSHSKAYVRIMIVANTAGSPLDQSYQGSRLPTIPGVFWIPVSSHALKARTRP